MWINIKKLFNKSLTLGRFIGGRCLCLILPIPHFWAYRDGDSKGVIGGETRHGCLIRACRCCFKKQEIDRWLGFSKIDGNYYNYNPDWMDRD